MADNLTAVYVKRGALTPEERKLALELLRALKERYSEEEIKLRAPCTSLVDLKEVHKLYCTKN